MIYLHSLPLNDDFPRETHGFSTAISSSRRSVARRRTREAAGGAVLRGFRAKKQGEKYHTYIYIYIIHICMGDIPDLQSTSHKLHIAGFYCFNSLRKIPSQGHQLWRRVRAMGRMTCLPKVLMISEQLNHGIPQKQEDIATQIWVNMANMSLVGWFSQRDRKHQAVDAGFIVLKHWHHIIIPVECPYQKNNDPKNIEKLDTQHISSRIPSLS